MEYKQVIADLQQLRVETSTYPSLKNAIDVMIKWLNEYQHEAAKCDAIVLATVLNPRFRQKFFSLHYPDYNVSSQDLIEEAFENLVEESLARETTPLPDQPVESVETDAFDVFGGSNDIPDKPSQSELDDYLQGQFPIKKDQTPLNWWKVCLLFFLFSLVSSCVFC